MPKWFDRKVRRRDGAIRWRNIKKGGRTFRCAITRKKGKRGGRTVCYKLRKK